MAKAVMTTFEPPQVSMSKSDHLVLLAWIVNWSLLEHRKNLDQYYPCKITLTGTTCTTHRAQTTQRRKSEKSTTVCSGVHSPTGNSNPIIRIYIFVCNVSRATRSFVSLILFLLTFYVSLSHSPSLILHDRLSTTLAALLSASLPSPAKQVSGSLPHFRLSLSRSVLSLFSRHSQGPSKGERVTMHTINPTKMATRFPILNPTRGLPSYGFPRNLQQKKRFGEASFKKMAWSLKTFDEGSTESRSGIVRPATEAYADEAIQALKAGKVIAVPTDTLYGFACDACSVEAVNRIYEIKGREHTKPLAICVGDVNDIGRFAVTNHLPFGLLDNLLPGPVTVVLARGETSIITKSLNAGLDTIGVRVPDFEFIRMIARGCESALALTSANLSGHPSSLDIKEFKSLWEHCTFVYDGGVLPAGRAGSTIVDLTINGKYKILRPGSAKEETIAILERYSLQEGATG